MRLATTPAILLLAAAPDAPAATIHVPGDQPTLQAAIFAAANGDTLLVGPGTYAPAFASSLAELTIRSEAGPTQTIIDAGGNEGTCLSANNGTFFIDGLQLVGAHETGYGYEFGVGFTAWNSNVEIRNCVFEGNWSGAIDMSGSLRLHDSTFLSQYVTCKSTVNAGFGDVLIEGCTFDGQDAGANSAVIVKGNSGWITATIRDNVFRNNSVRSGDVFYVQGPIYDTDATIVVEHNLFHDSEGPVLGTNHGPSSQFDLRFRHNTVIRQTKEALNIQLDPGDGSILIEANAITGGFVAVANDAVRPGVKYSCNLVWGNVQNWPWFDDQTGINGNISVPPLYCSPGADDFTLATNSPCLPPNNSCGIQIGAFGQGCGPVSVEPETWAGIKARYR